MDRLLIITGGSRGIGLATIRAFVSDGYRAINLSRSPTDLDLATQCKVDLSDTDWPRQVGGDLLDLVGTPDRIVLIHNAALLLKDSLQDAPEFARVMQVNLIAAQQLNQLMLPRMKPGSSILYLGSTLSKTAVANTLTYSTSKHAVLGLMRATCQDLIGQSIHTPSICPGFTDTGMLRDHIGQDEEIMKILGEANAFGRLVNPEERANCLKFCAENPAINGAEIDANLGQIEH